MSGISPSDIRGLDATSIAAALRRRELTSVEVTQAYLEAIGAGNQSLGAYLTVDEEGAMAQARGVDARRAKGEELGPYAGVPVAVKDNISTRGLRTTCASRILENYVPPYDATVIARLRQSGLVVLGKTNMDEFAMGSSGENSAFFPARNPWDLSRVPGGSSSGSAVAVAASLAPWALGSDTGGSVRQPASFCGLVGVKPTYGRVSRYGLVAFASSLDQIGTITHDAAEAAALMGIISGYDPADSTSVPEPVPDYPALLGRGIRGLRVGVVREGFGEGVEPGVQEALRRALDVLAGLGAVVEEVSLSMTAYALPAYYVIAPAEASSNLARYDGVRYGLRSSDRSVADMYGRTRQAGFGPEVKRRIMLGTYALSAGYYDAYYKKAQQIRTLIKNEFSAALQSYDVLVTPTAPSVAFPLGEKSADPVQMYYQDYFTIPVNMAGLPAVSVPCGFSGGLPVGMQLIGRWFDEAGLLAAAHAYLEATGWHRFRPQPAVFVAGEAR